MLRGTAATALARETGLKLAFTWVIARRKGRESLDIFCGVLANDPNHAKTSCGRNCDGPRSRRALGNDGYGTDALARQ